MASLSTVWLFTMRFPFGKGEPFLENELPVLCAHFDKVMIVPLFAQGDRRTLPGNAEVVQVLRDPYAGASVMEVLRQGGTYLSCMSALALEAPSPAMFRKRKAELRSRVRQAMRRAADLERVLEENFDPSKELLYSYWTVDWATVLALLKHRHPEWRMVSRVHGFDLFPERAKDGWIPFRSMHLEAMDRIHCVSQAGLDTMSLLHPAHKEKFHLARLGTEDHGPGPWTPSSALRLVSCSNLVPLKRVDLLVEALMRMQRPVQWTHFGDGPERARLERRIADLPANVQVELKGAVANTALMAWYRAHPVDLFVHLSASEGGIPVSIQEAVSFGIPVVACDAGGVREIVGPATGRLLPLECGADLLAGTLEELGSTLAGDRERRKQVRAVWSEGFQAPVNFGHFCASLLQLMG